MSALCNCFKSNPQVTDNHVARSNKSNRNSIAVSKPGMELLELQKRGMQDQNEEWIEEEDPMRSSNYTGNGRSEILPVSTLSHSRISQVRLSFVLLLTIELRGHL